MMSNISKSKRVSEDGIEESRPKKRRATSCQTCRRLKTRCEIQSDTNLCHRCKLMGLECSPTKDEGLSAINDQLMITSELIDEGNTRRHDRYEERLSSIEGTVSAIQASMGALVRHFKLSRTSIPDMQKPITTSSVNISPTLRKAAPLIGIPLVADRNSRTAPMSLIRNMKQYILGDGEGSQGKDHTGDIISQGIISKAMANELLSGFSKLSRRWLFMKSNPANLRSIAPLLFPSCVLAGVQIDSSHHGTQLHIDLYHHVSSLLGKAMIISPLPLETIQSMLIFSMWNHVPNRDAEHLDTWLLSGVAGMQGMLAINFEQLLVLRTDGLVDPRSRETLRSWNLICLVHLQFSVGTGRPSVLSRQYLKQCKNILSLGSYNSRDQMVVLGIELYDSLCTLVNEDTVQTDSVVWIEVEDWKRKCGEFFDLDSTKPLRFAYSCSYLILARRSLKYLSELPSAPANSRFPTGDRSFEPTELFQLAIEHALRILHLFLAMSDLTNFVRPAYENLLCSFAMVTISELAMYLEDPEETLGLMERTSQHVQRGGKAEPVSKWALGVMQRFVHDLPNVTSEMGQGQNGGSEQVLEDDTSVGNGSRNLGSFLGGLESEWSQFGVAYEEFPSLEEMFLGN